MVSLRSKCCIAELPLRTGLYMLCRCLNMASIFEHSDAMKICDGIMFRFHPGTATPVNVIRKLHE